jgi:hypothetical protein
MMARTTDLFKIEMDGEPFSWGRVVQVHHISNYAVIECYPWKTKGSIVEVGIPDLSKKEYHSYVDKKPTNTCYETLDQAIVGCIAYKVEGSNHKMDYYFSLMVRGHNL